MEGSDGSPSRGQSRTDAARQTRAAIEERQQRFLATRQQYQPRLHEQIQRLFRDYQPPVYARLRGYNRDSILSVIESRVVAVSAGTERSFSDTEVQAVTEHLLDSIRNVLIWKWAMTGMAAYMTYRGRRTWRFPFFKPPADGRFSPQAGNPSLKLAWHSARFAAYYGVLLILGEPIFQGVNFMRQSSSMMADPRLSHVLRDAKALGQNQWGSSGPVSDEQQQQDNSSDMSWSQESQSDSQSQFSEPEPNGVAAQAQSAWARHAKPKPSPPAPQQSGGWDAVSDVIDDASPVAPSDQGSANPSYAGSAWDRVRQQAQYSPSHARQQGQQTWQRPQATGGWGNDADSSAPRQSPSDNYTFSSADEDKVLAKNQAQREFDAMLDKERGGTEQNGASWGRR